MVPSVPAVVTLGTIGTSLEPNPWNPWNLWNNWNRDKDQDSFLRGLKLRTPRLPCGGAHHREAQTPRRDRTRRPRWVQRVGRWGQSRGENAHRFSLWGRNRRPCFEGHHEV